MAKISERQASKSTMDMQALGRSIRDTRGPVSREAVARKAGCSTRTIFQLEENKVTRVSTGPLVRIAMALGAEAELGSWLRFAGYECSEIQIALLISEEQRRIESQRPKPKEVTDFLRLVKERALKNDEAPLLCICYDSKPAFPTDGEVSELLRSIVVNCRGSIALVVPYPDPAKWGHRSEVSRYQKLLDYYQGIYRGVARFARELKDRLASEGLEPLAKHVCIFAPDTRMIPEGELPITLTDMGMRTRRVFVRFDRCSSGSPAQRDLNSANYMCGQYVALGAGGPGFFRMDEEAEFGAVVEQWVDSLQGVMDAWQGRAGFGPSKVGREGYWRGYEVG